MSYKLKMLGAGLPGVIPHTGTNPLVQGVHRPEPAVSPHPAWHPFGPHTFESKPQASVRLRQPVLASFANNTASSSGRANAWTPVGAVLSASTLRAV